ncbi:hypothetical protein APY94_07745 [Thermococcus celericrescens]|uniref:Uncharacterized protein n=1 Tax=Thermococcus celericrescens TaxID=227598 RepID=A0A100XX54_9EURY|nr:hypothetical protein APY94_07745 [Thermococcus celericrescens]
MKTSVAHQHAEDYRHPPDLKEGEAHRGRPGDEPPNEYRVGYEADLLSAVKGESSKELTPRHLRRGFRALISYSSREFRLGPKARSRARYPYRQTGLGVIAQGHSTEFQTAQRRFLKRTLNSVFPPMAGGHAETPSHRVLLSGLSEALLHPKVQKGFGV